MKSNLAKIGAKNKTWALDLCSESEEVEAFNNKTESGTFLNLYKILIFMFAREI